MDSPPFLSGLIGLMGGFSGRYPDSLCNLSLNPIVSEGGYIRSDLLD